jgi:Fe-S cluster biosynthesis and repair protein YggX
VDAVLHPLASGKSSQPGHAPLEFRKRFEYRKRERVFHGGTMAEEQASQNPAGENVRMVKCVKFGREMPGLDRVPWKGEIGKRVYDNVSKEGWKLWVEHSKMLMNEYRLNPLDPNSLKIMEEQMEQFFFGEGSKLPDSYVAPKH